MGVHDRDWWREKYDQARHDPKQLRSSRHGKTSPARSKSHRAPPGGRSSFALKAATILLFLVVAVIACLRKSHLI